MDIKLFTLLTFIGSFIWSGVLAYLGLTLGQNWQAVEPFFRKFQFAIIGIGVLLAAAYIYRHIKRKD